VEHLFIEDIDFKNSSYLVLLGRNCFPALIIVFTLFTKKKKFSFGKKISHKVAKAQS
jgi:hypothetical protein